VDKEKDSYKLPDTYFEDFQNRLHTQITLEDLIGKEKKTGFIVPEGYFEELSRKLSNIPLYRETTPKVIPFKIKNILWPSISIAAAVLLFFTLFTRDANNDSSPLEVDDIAIYLDVESPNLHTQDIAALLTEEEINTLILSDTKAEEDELINYLETYTNPYDLLIE